MARNQHTAFIGLGANEGDREKNLQNAVRLLDEEDDTHVLATSSLYETAPVGVTDQPSFLNLVVKVSTSRDAEALLSLTQAIEQAGGRKRKEKWGPRTIDLDILLYNEENIKLSQLQIPHPRMFERGFVLIPLQEIEPDMCFSDGRKIEDYVDHLTDKEGVHKWKSSFGGEESGRFES